MMACGMLAILNPTDTPSSQISWHTHDCTHSFSLLLSIFVNSIDRACCSVRGGHQRGHSINMSRPCAPNKMHRSRSAAAVLAEQYVVFFSLDACLQMHAVPHVAKNVQSQNSRDTMRWATERFSYTFAEKFVLQA